MSIEELLKTDTSKLSLSEMIASVGGDVLDRPDDVYRLRKRHENDSGIPMEEDDFGIREKDGIHGAFPGIVKSLNDVVDKERTNAMDYYSFLTTAQDSSVDKLTDPGNRRMELGKEFIDGAIRIGRKYSCFYEAVQDDNALYVQLQPALDFSKNYGWQPSNKERVDEFKKFRKEIDELAERVGCKRTQYLWNPNVKTLSNKDRNGRDYMNSLVTSVKESVWKKAGRDAAKNEKQEEGK